MADETMTKKVTDLTESTEPTDEDLFLAGSAGTASLRKIKWSNIWTKITSSILNKLVANNLITTAAGFLLDARQGKVLDDKLTELNTNMNKRKHLAQYIAGTSGNNYVEITVPDGNTLASTPMMIATLNSHIAGAYVVGVTRVSDTVLKVYFNQSFTGAAIVAVDYTVN